MAHAHGQEGRCHMHTGSAGRAEADEFGGSGPPAYPAGALHGEAPRALDTQVAIAQVDGGKATVTMQRAHWR